MARQLQIKDPNVSERHAEIFWDGKAWNVRDLGSSNGTEVNDRPLERQGRCWARDVSAIQGGQANPWMDAFNLDMSDECVHACTDRLPILGDAGDPVVLRNGDTVCFGGQSVATVEARYVEGSRL